MSKSEVFDASLGILIYETVGNFYDERGGRTSGECDFGVWNKDDMMLFATPPKGIRARVAEGLGMVVSAGHNKRLRVSVVEETGDVYAFEEGVNARAALLGNVGLSDPDWRSRPFKERSPVYARADEIFDGYATDSDGSLGRPVSWFVERLRDAE